MLDGRRQPDGRLSGVTKEGKIGLETSFGRFEFDPEIIDNARIDPREIFHSRIRYFKIKNFSLVGFKQNV